jgi:hypothetical protein
MTARRFTSLFALAFVGILLTSCADDLTSPTAPPPQPVAIQPRPLLGGLIGTVVGVAGDLLDLDLADCPAGRTQSGSALIGPKGGTVKIGPHRLYVPRGALKETVHISGVAPSGDYAQIKFEPEGLKFKKPVALVMSYDDCRLEDLEKLRIIYASDNLEILEVFPTVISRRDETATTSLDHFSRYMLAE